MLVRVTKIKDLEDALHPNNIAEGFTKEGEFISTPTLGEPLWVGLRWRTSPVKDILPDNTFKTYNSIYKWELVEPKEINQ